MKNKKVKLLLPEEGKMHRIAIVVLCLALSCSAFKVPARTLVRISSVARQAANVRDEATSAGLAAATLAAVMLASSPAFAENGGASEAANSKIRNGGASTIVNQRGARKTITRGVQLDGSDFSNDDLGGVSFQQSQIRNGNWKNCKLVGASFFDATLDDSDFEGANMNQVGGSRRTPRALRNFSSSPRATTAGEHRDGELREREPEERDHHGGVRHRGDVIRGGQHRGRGLHRHLPAQGPAKARA